MTAFAWDNDGASLMVHPSQPAGGPVELDTLFRPTQTHSPAMAPDRGSSQTDSPAEGQRDDNGDVERVNDQDSEPGSDNEGPHAFLLQPDDAQTFLAKQAEQGQDFTLRGVLVGLAIGVIICFSNMYFGLQTGWVSGMAMPAALIGFGFFKTVARCIDYPFTPVENVLVQTVAGALGTMPLGCGFVGVMPALNYLLKSEENGPLVLSTGKLIVWSLGICFFGVVFAVPLRKEVIIREKLKFPSGTATALMIGVLHGNTDEKGKKKQDDGLEIFRQRSQDIRRSTSLDAIPAGRGGRNEQVTPTDYDAIQTSGEEDHRDDWKANIRLLGIAFGISAVYVRPASSEYIIDGQLMHSDSCLIFYPSAARTPYLWTPPSKQLAMEAKPIPSVRRPRHNNGPSNNPTHAPWRSHRLGYSLSPSKNQRLGAWSRLRLDHR